jgi:predicted permease
MLDLIRSIRRSARALAATPALSFAAFATLALGCGAAIAVGTIVDALLFRPLPAVENRDALLVYPTAAGALDPDSDALDLNETEAIAASGAVAEVGTLLVRNLTLTAGDPERVAGASVSPNFFDILGVRPEVGRFFRADEATPWGQEQVAVIAHGLWVRRFAADPAIAGKTIEVNQRKVTVAGVLPPGFGLPESQQVYLPWRVDPEWERDSRDFWVVARPVAGLAPSAAQSAAATVAERLVADGTIADRDRGFRLVPLRDALYDRHAARMMALLSLLVVALVGVACFNVANLLLARNAAREGELAVRLALGASRGRILAQVLTETALLAGAGAALGMLLGAWGLERIVASLEEELPAWLRLEIDGRVAVGTVALAAAVALVAGLLPALRAGRTQVTEQLVAAGRASAVGARRPLERSLVALQFAAALVVLAAAGWLLASASAIARSSPGFDPTKLLSLRLYLPGDAYDPLAAKIRFRARLLEQLEALPGARAAAVTGQLPADDGGEDVRVTPEGVAPSPESSTPSLMIGATRTLFDALGAPLVAGSTWSRAEDEDESGSTAVINRALADKLWPGESPLGRRLRLGLDPAGPPLEVVGIAPDLTYEEIMEQSSRSRYQVFVPLARFEYRSLSAIVRVVAGDPAALTAPARRALGALEPDAPMFDVATYPQRLRRTYEDRTLVGRLAAIFGAAGLALAAVGLFGLLAHSVARRRRELGVRMALGAAPARLVRAVVGDGIRLALPGVAAGLALAYAAAHALAGTLFGVDPTAPWRFVVQAALVFVAAALASAFAARRIVAIEPTSALRQE